MKQKVLSNLNQAQVAIARALEAAMEGQRQAGGRGDGDLNTYQTAINKLYEASYTIRDALAVVECLKK